MAALGPGPHRSGDIAEGLGRKVDSLGPMRSALIGKGMVYSPEHGDTAFSVPLFNQFMKRVMPGGNDSISLVLVGRDSCRHQWMPLGTFAPLDGVVQ